MPDAQEASLRGAHRWISFGLAVTPEIDMYPELQELEAGSAPKTPSPSEANEAATESGYHLLNSSGKAPDMANCTQEVPRAHPRHSDEYRRPQVPPRGSNSTMDSNEPFRQAGPNQDAGESARSQDHASHNADDLDVEACYELVDESSSGVNHQAQSERPHRAAPKKRTFILRKTTEAQKRAHMAQATDANGFIDRYDYLKKYPHDEPEQAMGPNGRVWRVYLDEAAQFDIDMVDNFKDTVDVMLVFAGLFSAVVTTFVVQSSTALQLDYNQVMASILLEQLTIQRAFFNGSPIPDTQSPPLGIVSSTTTGLDRWANGLWFTSLSFSLATALFAVLVKQWIQAYISPVSGTPQTQAQVRHYRYMGLKKWHLPLIVGLLPTLLHLSLLLFLMGLVVFLAALDGAIAGVTGFIAISIYIIYFITNLAPVFDSQCPYKTPLSRYALLLLHPYVTRLRDMWTSVKRPVVRTSHRASQLWSALATHAQPLIQLFNQLIGNIASISKDTFTRIRRLFFRSHPECPPFPKGHRLIENHSSMKDSELRDIRSQSDAIDARAMCWVLSWSSNPSVTAVVIEAASDLPFQFSAKDLLREEGVASAACTTIDTCAGSWPKSSTQELEETPKPGFERLCYKAVLVHHQLDLNQDHGHLRRSCSCRFRYPSVLLSALNKPGEMEYDFALKFQFLASRPQEPWTPMHILQFSPPQAPKIVFLHLFQQVIRSLREAPCHSRTITPDWPSCCKLLADTGSISHLEDSYTSWRHTLVPVYLACLVCPEILASEESAPLLDWLSCWTDMSSSSPEDLLGPAFDFSLRCRMRVLSVMLKDPSASMGIEAWAKLKLFTEGLSTSIPLQITSIGLELGPEGRQEINAFTFHFEFLSVLLIHNEQYVNSQIRELNMLIFTLGTTLMQVEYADSMSWQHFGGICDRLMRFAILSQDDFGYSKQIGCLRALLQNGHPSCIEIFRQYDGLSLLDKYLQLHQEPEGLVDVPEARELVDLVLVYMSRVVPDCGGLPLAGSRDANCLSSSSHWQEGQSSPTGRAHFEYLLGCLVQIFMICAQAASLHHDWGFDSDGQLFHPPTRMRGLLCRLMETRPDKSIWEDAFSRAARRAQANSYLIRFISQLIQYHRQKLEEIHSYDAQEPQRRHAPQVNLLRASLVQVQSLELSLGETLWVEYQ